MIVRFFTFAIVDIYRKWVLISRNFAEFREIPKPRNSAKFRNFHIIDVGIPRNFVNNEIPKVQNSDGIPKLRNSVDTLSG